MLAVYCHVYLSVWICATYGHSHLGSVIISWNMLVYTDRAITTDWQSLFWLDLLRSLLYTDLLFKTMSFSQENVSWIRRQLYPAVWRQKWTMNETLIFIKIQSVGKISRLRLYLPRQKWTLKWNDNFYPNTKIGKIMRLRLYLPRQNWIMNKTIIFIKIRGVGKNNETEAVFTKTELNNE